MASEDHIERTFVMIKPDGVQRRLVGKIVARLEQKGLELRALKLKNLDI
ncbi:MAG: nucleoside-diphosphate kinase, partial [Halobacteriota archaeon]